MTSPAFPPFNRLVRKEVSLGTIRELLPPTDHIGLSVAPFLSVGTDDVIFDYIKGGLSEGLAPARAEDAEAELSQKDEGAYIQGRASVIDWSLKDKYSASDVTRFRDGLLLLEQLGGVNSLSVAQGFVGNTVADFEARVARHDALRRRKLDNRIEWLIWSALESGKIVYNDGRIKFTVDYGRPAIQQNIPITTAGALGGGGYALTGVAWGQPTSDPISDLIAINNYMFDTYGITLNRCYLSRKVVQNVWKSSKFLQAIGQGILLPTQVTGTLDTNYLTPGYGPEAALGVVTASTGITFNVYDAVYRTRSMGSTVWQNNRFFSDNKLLLLPDESQLQQIDDTEIGFAKTLTSPHPEGNWASGYYEWEDEKRDPWIHVRGSGIKAFPVFPFMQYSATVVVM